MMLSLMEDKWSTVRVMDQLWEDDLSDEAEIFSNELCMESMESWTKDYTGLEVWETI